MSTCPRRSPATLEEEAAAAAAGNWPQGGGGGTGLPSSSSIPLTGSASVASEDLPLAPPGCPPLAQPLAKAAWPSSPEGRETPTGIRVYSPACNPEHSGRPKADRAGSQDGIALVAKRTPSDASASWDAGAATGLESCPGGAFALSFIASRGGTGRRAEACPHRHARFHRRLQLGRRCCLPYPKSLDMEGLVGFWPTLATLFQDT